MDNPHYQGAPVDRPSDDGKTAAIVAYITIIGWLISYFALYKENRTPLAGYHLRQTLLLFLVGVGLTIVRGALIFTAPFLAVLLGLASLALFVFWLIGLIGAIQGRPTPIPLIGEPAQRMFAGI